MGALAAGPQCQAPRWLPCGWGLETKKRGLRFRALLSGSAPELNLDAVWSCTEATSRTIYSVWKADQDTDSDDGAPGSVASRGIVP